MNSRRIRFNPKFIGWLILLILFILYTIFFALGGSFIVSGIIRLLLMGRTKNLKKLMDTGIRVSCVIEEVTLNKNISVCGVSIQ